MSALQFRGIVLKSSAADRPYMHRSQILARLEALRVRRSGFAALRLAAHTFCRKARPLRPCTRRSHTFRISSRRSVSSYRPAAHLTESQRPSSACAANLSSAMSLTNVELPAVKAACKAKPGRGGGGSLCALDAPAKKGGGCTPGATCGGALGRGGRRAAPYTAAHPPPTQSRASPAARAASPPSRLRPPAEQPQLSHQHIIRCTHILPLMLRHPRQLLTTVRVSC